jgi:opacity protein-like surface antigen
MTQLMAKKTLVSAILFAGIQVTTAANAQANWYSESTLLDADVSGTSLNSTGRNVNAEFESDTAFGGAIGYQYNGGLRIEAEYLSTENDTNAINFNGNSFSGNTVSGSLETQSIFVNAIQSFGSSSIQPYLGVGIGFSKVESNIAYNPTLSAAINDDDTAFSYQFLAGIDIPFSESFTGFVEYRYVDISDVSLSRRGGGPGGIATTSQNGDINFDAFAVGLRYSF